MRKRDNTQLPSHSVGDMDINVWFSAGPEYSLPM